MQNNCELFKVTGFVVNKGPRNFNFEPEKKAVVWKTICLFVKKQQAKKTSKRGQGFYVPFFFFRFKNTGIAANNAQQRLYWVLMGVTSKSQSIKGQNTKAVN